MIYIAFYIYAKIMQYWGAVSTPIYFKWLA